MRIETYLRGPLSWILSPLGWLFGGLVSLRRRVYRKGWKSSVKASVPVWSIGNLAVGGTGKTPLLFDLVSRFERADGVVGVLSRGYGQDEGRMLEARHPEVILHEGPDRVANLAAMEDLDEPPNIIVLDDGFQHLAIQRDVNVVLLDATRPFGKCMPAGLFREPASALRAADLVVLTRSELVSSSRRDEIWEKIHAVREDLPPLPRVEGGMQAKVFRRLEDGKEVLCSEWSESSVFVACGIGNPASFCALVSGLGMSISGTWFEPDHSPWPQARIQQLEEHPCVLVTEKDAVKLVGKVSGNVWALEAEFVFTKGEEPWEDLVERTLLPMRASAIEPLWSGLSAGDL